MSDEEIKKQELDAQQKKDQLEAERKSLEGKSTQQLLDIIFETRSEARDRRLKEQELSKRLEKIESDKTEEEKKKKIEEGKQGEVITELTDKLKKAEEKAKKFDEYDSTKRVKLKEIFGEKWMPSFEKPEVVPLIELEDLASKLTNSGESLLDSDNGKNKKQQPGKLEGLKKDLQLATERKDIVAQMQIKRLIAAEEKKK